MINEYEIYRFICRYREDLDMAYKKQDKLNVSGQMSGTNTQAKHIKNTMESATQETFKQLLQTKSQTTIYSALVFLANHLVSREKDWDLKTQEGLCFLKSLGLSKTKDPDIFCLKMLKAYLVMTKEKLSRQYLGFSPTWGMSINGKFLTAKISESPRIGKECSLSEILEEQADLKYFLSEEKSEKLLAQGMWRVHSKQTTSKETGLAATLLKRNQFSHQKESTKDKTAEGSKMKENQCSL